MQSHLQSLGLVNIVSGLRWELLGLGILAGFFLLAPVTGDSIQPLALLSMGWVLTNTEAVKRFRGQEP